MIYAADIASTGPQHEQINTSLLALLKRGIGSEALTFISDKSHGEILRKSVKNIAFEDIEIYKGRGGLREFIRGYHQFKSLAKVVSLANKNGASHVYVFLIHPFAHFLFKLLTKERTIQISIILHGELESVKFNKHLVNKVWGYFLKQALTMYSPNIKYITLGKSIYSNLLKVLPAFSRQKCIVMDHPYPFSFQKSKVLHDHYISFSSIGVATLAKNSQYLFKVAQQATDLGINAYCKFNICGRVYSNMIGHLNDSVNYKKDFGSFSRNELDTLISESDYCIFYYENKHYSLCASGAFWDAVNAEVPLLYVHNDYFDYYADLVGDLGKAFQTADELNDYVISLVQNRDQQDPLYLEYIKNMKNLKYQYMKEENLLNQLKESML
jgi:hypothetical protein